MTVGQTEPYEEPQSEASSELSALCFFTLLLVILHKRTHSSSLFCPVYRLDPSSSVFGEDLYSRLEHRVVQSVIVDDAASHKACSRRKGACAEHERTTGLAEAVGHCVSGRDGMRLSIDGQIVLASNEAGVRVERGEIGCEHRGRDLAAVGTMADECVHEARRLQRLQ